LWEQSKHYILYHLATWCFPGPKGDPCLCPKGGLCPKGVQCQKGDPGPPGPKGDQGI